MTNEPITPRSPKEELDGFPYFLRLCDKIRLFQAGILHPDYHNNLGKGFDLWMCQFLGVEYDDLRKKVESGASDEQTLAWAQQTGVEREPFVRDWFLQYLRTRGFRDDFSELLEKRKKEAEHTDKPEIQTFMDYLDADEGH